MKAYRLAETRVMKVVALAFGCTPAWPPPASIEYHDKVVLATEVAALMTPLAVPWKLDAEPDERLVLDPLPPTRACDLYMARFAELEDV